MNIIGQNVLKKELEVLISNADIYKRELARVPDFVINLKPEDGREIITDYIVDVLYEHRLRRFSSLEHKLEFVATEKNCRAIFDEIEKNAGYSNTYEGVIAIDVSELIKCMNESCFDYFLEKLSSVAITSTIIVYYNGDLGKRMEAVIERIKTALTKHVDIHVEPYTNKELAQIIIQTVKDRGADVEDEKKVETILSKFVKKSGINNVAEAVEFAEELVFCADCTSIIPVIRIDKVNEMFNKADSL